MGKTIVNLKSILVTGFILLFSLSLISSSAEAKKKKHTKISFPQSRPATGNTVFIFNPNSLKWAIYSPSGNLVRTGHGVGGKHYCPDVGRGCKTPVGTYRIYSKVGPEFRSSRYPFPKGGAPMPWGMFFHKGYAIHGSNDVPHYNASHGCIRVYTKDAKWMNQGALPMGSTVIVKGY
jgi:lipoprotein-anchoring transpeptidase ErfK/SrfK